MAGGRPPAWGWYRLDRSWAERLVAESGIARGDLVLDVGAARRWAEDGATSGHHLRTGTAVPRSAFRPAPPTDGRILVIERSPRGPVSASHRPTRGR